jgi:hypothetical protein
MELSSMTLEEEVQGLVKSRRVLKCTLCDGDYIGERTGL